MRQKTPSGGNHTNESASAGLASAGRMFFFEKKNQKTFVFSRGLATARKSFLLLFSLASGLAEMNYT
jgi:hypothetical protein